MTVLSIIAILLSIALPKFDAYFRKADETEYLAIFTELIRQIATYTSDWKTIDGPYSWAGRELVCFGTTTDVNCPVGNNFRDANFSDYLSKNAPGLIEKQERLFKPSIFNSSPWSAPGWGPFFENINPTDGKMMLYILIPYAPEITIDPIDWYGWFDSTFSGSDLAPVWAKKRCSPGLVDFMWIDAATQYTWCRYYFN